MGCVDAASQVLRHGQKMRRAASYWFGRLWLLSGISVLACCTSQAALRQQETQIYDQCRSAAPADAKRLAVSDAECLTRAEDAVIRPHYRYQDLLSLEQAYRLDLATKVDSGAISPAAASLQMAQIRSQLQGVAEQRNVARAEAAAQSQAAYGALLQGLAASRPPPQTPVYLNTSCNRFGTTVNCTSTGY
jgi:hypothetical protein